MLQKMMTVAALAVMAGCSSTGPTKIGDDTYLVSKKVYALISSATALEVECREDAANFCAKQGKESEVTNVNLSGGFSEARVEFKCVNKAK